MGHGAPGAGLGLTAEEKGPDYDLSRFKAEQEKKGAAHEPTPQEIAHLRELEAELERKLAAQRAGMPIPEDEPAMLDEDIQRLIDERQEARHRRDFSRADEIRDQLAARGITLEDTRDGVRWKRR